MLYLLLAIQEHFLTCHIHYPFFFIPQISSIRLCKNDSIAVTVESSRIKFNSFSNGICLLEITQYIDPPVITTASENDNLVVALFTGSNVMRTWDVSGENVQVLVEVDIGGQGIHQDESLSVSFSPFGERVLYAYRSSNTAFVVNAKTGNKVGVNPNFL